MALFPSYQIEGIASPDKITADLASQCRDIFNAPVRVDISTESVNGHNVIVVFVPEAQSQDKPVFSRHRGYPRVRSGESAARTSAVPMTTWQFSIRAGNRKVSIPALLPTPRWKTCRQTRSMNERYEYYWVLHDWESRAPYRQWVRIDPRSE